MSLLPVPKGTHLGYPRRETNHSWMVFTSYFLGMLQIQAKSKQVLNHPEDLSFISARPAHPDLITFSRRGLFKNGVEKGKIRNQF
jgi:hypothetical protein